MHSKRELTNHSSLCNSLVPQALVHGPVNVAIYGIIYIHEVMMHDNVVSTSLVLRSRAAFIASLHCLQCKTNLCMYPMNAASGLGMRLATFAVNRASV